VSTRLESSHANGRQLGEPRLKNAQFARVCVCPHIHTHTHTHYKNNPPGSSVAHFDDAKAAASRGTSKTRESTYRIVIIVPPVTALLLRASSSIAPPSSGNRRCHFFLSFRRPLVQQRSASELTQRSVVKLGRSMHAIALEPPLRVPACHAFPSLSLSHTSRAPRSRPWGARRRESRPRRCYSLNGVKFARVSRRLTTNVPDETDRNPLAVFPNCRPSWTNQSASRGSHVARLRAPSGGEL